MNTTIKPRLTTALLVFATVLLPVGDAIADWAPMNGGMMGNGNWYGNGGVWLPVLAIVVVGAVLFAVLRRRQ
ncbi:MAG: hypothetical protein MUO39_07025 [Steroidobacteraceae bacterium]|nr:hypothetical protein [Steroidobacteraceae bacterium]